MNQRVFPKLKFCLKTKLTLKLEQQPTPLPGLIVFKQEQCFER